VNKKDTTIGVLFILAAFFCIWLNARNSRRVVSPAEMRQEATKQEQSAAQNSAGVLPAAPAATTPETSPTLVAATPEHAGATITSLENSFVRFDFTDFGGAIRDASLKKYTAELHNPDPFVINKVHANPMLAFVNYPGLDQSTRFLLVSHTPNEVDYRATVDRRLEVTRRYVLSPDSSDATDPYQLRVETTFKNLTDQAVAPTRVSWAVGAASPINDLDRGLDLASFYSDGKDQNPIARSSLDSSGGIFGLNPHGPTPAIKTDGPIVWGAVKNQFFSSILTLDEPGLDMTTSRVKSLIQLPDDANNAYGITAFMELGVPALTPHGTTTLGASFYVGPNEYHRLSNPDVFKASQNKILNFGFFKFFSEILLTLMTWVHSRGFNWGLSIVLTTLILRSVMMLFTIPASRSARRMQKIQPELKALREKYKDNPQKQQTATMEVFKKHKINPVGGCVPMLLTLPFFWGFYAMLRKTPELRFASFLWAKDLSAPDTVHTFFKIHPLPIVGSLDLNILPILLCIVTFLQMRVTPQPTVDNAQAKMMKFTPLFFMAICYSYSCALALYSTTNGLFMIGQQMLVNRMKDDGDPTHAHGAVEKAGGKPIKNVTPAKKK
jgi:YidC/Oxa1 family membrane protein insertase